MQDAHEATGGRTDETALMRSAQSAIPTEDVEQLLDFRCAVRIARQHGTDAYESQFSAVPSQSECEGAVRRTGRKRKQRFSSLYGF